MKKANIIFLTGLVLSICTLVFGQDKGNETAADRTLRGSGRVNASTLGMEFELPLGSYPGRGISVPINLSYSSKLWRLEYLANNPDPGGNQSPCYKHYAPKFSENAASGWTTSMATPYIEYLGAKNFYNADGTPVSNDNITCPTTGGGNETYAHYYIRRIIVHLPSGETHELRPDDTPVGFVNNAATDPTAPAQPAMWNATYYAADGSNIKYVQNSTNNTYRLLMTDGSFYDFDPAAQHLSDRKAVRFTDRNGNYTGYHAPDSTYPNGYWTDTLGRIIAVPLGLQAPLAPTAAGNPQAYTMPGMTGSYKLHWKLLKNSSAAESGLTDFSQNLRYLGDSYICQGTLGQPMYCRDSNSTNSLFFGGEDARIFRESNVFNPVVLTEIELPTGQKYKFSYDVYARIEKIKYPTGGEEKFQYDKIPALSMLEPTDSVGGQTNFGVTNRKVYEYAGDASPYEWTYGASYPSLTAGYKITINNPDGTKNERYLHRGYDYLTVDGAFGFESALSGMAYEERLSNSANQVVSKKLTNWTKTVTQEPANWHPHATSEETQIFDSNGNGVSTTTVYEYEGDLSQRETPVLMKKTSQYAFVAVGSALPASPVRTSETTFLISDPNYSTVRDYYKNQNMVGLITSTIVRNGSGTIVSGSEMKYDESAYPVISPTENPIGWQNPNNLYRGNPTTSRVWDSTKGIWNNANAYIAMHAQFDKFGNQRKTWDAKGNLTETDYTSPSGQDYKFAFPTKVVSAVPDANPSQNPDGQAHGANTAFLTTATFDVVTGLPLTTTDPNGLETRIEYDLATLRPRFTRTFYNGGQVGSMSETVYHDEPGNYWVKSRTQIDTGKWAETISYFDGLGRAYKAEEVDSNGNIFVEKEFDQDGRVKRVTNPFRTGEIKVWTTNVYDEASRIKEVILPDGARVKTNYGVLISDLVGVTKQITDQAGKKRKGVSDALGRMIRVTEDPDGQNLNTDYVFDTLGNLRKTIQGEQSRYFSYDSLGRLLRAKQPEQEVNTNLALPNPDAVTGHNQWSVAYEYDDNGNITKTTDANGVYIEGVYDSLNRLKIRNYSDATPDVGFFYDGTGLASIPAFSKGKTTRVTSSVSETRYTSFDNLGRLLSSQQIIDGQIYNFGYQYNMSALVAETYPSGRIISFEFNADGDLARVSGQAGATGGCTANCARTYANSFNYSSSGAIESMRLGNGRWETAKYNSRQQITEIGLGASATDASLLKLEYGYGTSTENNGSLRTQKISFNGLAQPFEQIYTYDDLNRLLSAEEKINNSTNWKQSFSYDRYGNRRFNVSGTTTLEISNNITNPEISPATNRFSDGQTYLYDKNGSLTRNALGRQFFYDAENHQKEVKNADNQTIATYHYDGEGRRIKKVLTGSGEETIFVYDAGGQLAAEYVTNAQSQTQPAATRYLTADHLGSPRVITNELGNVISRSDYMAFGEETSTSQRTESLGYQPTNGVRQGYTGYQQDTESGLDFAQARYYNSAHGRFTSIDPLTASANIKNPQTFNRYSYVLNSPYKFSDPLGLISQYTGACGGECANSDPRNFGGGMASTNGGMTVDVTYQITEEQVESILAQQKTAGATSTNSITPTVNLPTKWTGITDGESGTFKLPKAVQTSLQNQSQSLEQNQVAYAINSDAAVKALTSEFKAIFKSKNPLTNASIGPTIPDFKSSDGSIIPIDVPDIGYGVSTGPVSAEPGKVNSSYSKATLDLVDTANAQNKEIKRIKSGGAAENWAATQLKKYGSNNGTLLRIKFTQDGSKRAITANLTKEGLIKVYNQAMGITSTTSVDRYTSSQ